MTRVLVPNPEQTIAEIAVLQSHLPLNPEEFSHEFPGLLGAFPQKVKVYWMYPQQNGQAALPPFEQGNLLIQPVPFPVLAGQTHSGNWEWLQDPFLVISQANLQFLLPTNSNPQDLAIVSALASAADATCKPLEVHVEGGNLIPFGGKWLGGKDLIWKNWKHHALGSSWWETHGKTTRHLQTELSAPIVWLGTDQPYPKMPQQPCCMEHNFQAFFHLDFFLMACGHSAEGLPRIAVAEIIPNWILGADPCRSKVVQQLQTLLEQTCTQLSKAWQGAIEIIRLPLALSLHSENSKVYSHLNGIYENGPWGERVLLPDFIPPSRSGLNYTKIKDLQNEVKDRLEVQGIRADFITNGFYENAGRCGALHCRVKVIRTTQIQ